MRGEKMAYADLHIHSSFSSDGTSDIETILRYTAEQTNLSIIAITDHNEIAGALLAEKLAPAYGLQVVTGSEVSTSEGHLLALFIREKVPAGMPLYETLMYVKKMGGTCIVPHPGARFTSSVSLTKIHAMLVDAQASQVLSGMEIFNAGLLRTNSNAQAANFALEHEIGMVASSDAHIYRCIGNGATGFVGSTLDELRHALEMHQTHILRHYAGSTRDIIWGWLYHRLIRSSRQLLKRSSAQAT
jgi:hypothetical protein